MLDSYRAILDAFSPVPHPSDLDKLRETASFAARLLGSEEEKERERAREREQELQRERELELERERERERQLERQRERERQQREAEQLERERAEAERAEQLSRQEKEKAEKEAAIAAAEKHVSNQVCLGCSATSTPEWRRGPMGPRTLCNACGLVYAKMMKKRITSMRGNQEVEYSSSEESSTIEEEEEDQLAGS